MEQSYAWISTCLACDAKVICQAITGFIGEVGENMKLEEVHGSREQGVGRETPGGSTSHRWARVILRAIHAEANSKTSLAIFPKPVLLI
jgi:hypothetical protein